MHPRLSSRTYLARVGPAADRPGFGAKRRQLEGFLFPATYDFLDATTSAQLVQQQLAGVPPTTGATSNLAYARSKNLTPYDVLIIASLVEKEALAPDERPKIARVIYNRLHAADEPRHRRDDPLRPARAGDEVADGVGARTATTRTTRATRASSGCRRPRSRTRASPSIQAAAHPAAGNWLYFVRKPDLVHHFFTDNYHAFLQYEATHGYHTH